MRPTGSTSSSLSGWAKVSSTSGTPEQARRIRLEDYRRRSRSDEDAFAISLGGRGLEYGNTAAASDKSRVIVRPTATTSVDNALSGSHPRVPDL
jgi:hypothetical protein